VLVALAERVEELLDRQAVGVVQLHRQHAEALRRGGDVGPRRVGPVEPGRRDHDRRAHAARLRAISLPIPPLPPTTMHVFAERSAFVGTIAAMRELQP
jgi:hypothetical protein